MSSTVQNVLVLLLVGACVAYLLRGLVGTFRGRKSSLGNCCATGCATPPDKSRQKTEKIVFLPVEMLTSRKR